MMDAALATAADRDFAYDALNLVGSVISRAPAISRMYVYDLGMTRLQRSFFSGIERVILRRVEAFCPHWRRCWSWKSWIWTTLPEPVVVYLDAGVEVLRSLEDVLTAVDRDGYFLVSQPGRDEGSHVVGEIVPSDYWERFGLSRKHADQQVVSAGVVAFRKDASFYSRVVEPLYDLVVQGYNLGWSRAELYRNRGSNYVANPVVRDAAIFRHDQTLLNLLVYREIGMPVVHSWKQFAGQRSREFHPEQVLWVHRRKSDLPFVDQIPYSRWPKGRRLVNRTARGARRAGRDVRQLVSRIRSRLRWS